MFSQHFLLDVETVKIYVKEKLNVFDKITNLEAQEIGDGNINYVFRVWDGNKSLIIKQADKLLRQSLREIDSSHNKIEASMLKFYNEIVSDYVPKLYLYDPIMWVIVMEDISSYKNLRNALLNRNIIPNLADNITSFIVNTTLLTSDLVMDSFIKKENVVNFINKEMCKITEDLVFTEIVIDYKNRNIITKENLSFVKEELYENENLIFEVAKLKNSFMNNPQALIHGDLHTGSIFVKEEKMKIIDPEFAFYGPIGYDLGVILANLAFALINTYIIDNTNQTFINWLENTIIDIFDKFKDKFIKKYQELVTDVSFKSTKFMNWYLNNILVDAAGCSGCELIRRTVGDSKVIDITSIEDINMRIITERILIKCGIKLILERNKILNGSEYIEMIKQTIKDFS